MRSRTLFGCVAAVAICLTGQGSAANAAAGEVICGEPLATGHGSTQYCGEDAGNLGRNGYYYPETKTYEWGPWAHLVCACYENRTLQATDGFIGHVHAYPRIEEVDGIHAYGTQYRAVIGGPQTQGRWGRVVYPALGPPVFEPATAWMDGDFDPEPGEN